MPQNIFCDVIFPTILPASRRRVSWSLFAMVDTKDKRLIPIKWVVSKEREILDTNNANFGQTPLSGVTFTLSFLRFDLLSVNYNKNNSSISFLKCSFLFKCFNFHDRLVDEYGEKKIVNETNK